MRKIMTRKFCHEITPQGLDPCKGDPAFLEVSEIERAGVFEVLKTPEAFLGTWSILDRLLVGKSSKIHGSNFTFREPLGQSNDIKGAISNLFSRFVARAYLTKYFYYSNFYPLHKGMKKIGKTGLTIEHNSNGDNPGWLTFSDFYQHPAIIEVKGRNYDRKPTAAMKTAWNQANRVILKYQGKTIPCERITVVTKLGVRGTKTEISKIYVRHSYDLPYKNTSSIPKIPCIKLHRELVANLLYCLNHKKLAKQILTLNNPIISETQNEEYRIKQSQALSTLNFSKVFVNEFGKIPNNIIGGVITQTGPIDDDIIKKLDRKILRNLNLKPVLVGIDSNLVHDLIVLDPDNFYEKWAFRTQNSKFSGYGNSYGWVIPHINIKSDFHIMSRFEAIENKIIQN